MIYDHERDAAESRRGRPVADWGGDELFSSTPRRRIKQTAPRARRYSGPAAGAHAVRRGETAVEHPAPLVDEQHEDRVHAPQAAAVAAPAPGHADVAMPTPLPAPERRPAASEDRPDPFPASRHRPGPTMQERLAGRPDRIAGWAFGLGITLILIAIGTADGGAF